MELNGHIVISYGGISELKKALKELNGGKEILYGDTGESKL